MAESDDSGTTDFVRNDQKKGILRKVIITIISIAVIVVGELVKDDDDLKKW